jgi:hypothetical protein
MILRFILKKWDGVISWIDLAPHTDAWRAVVINSSRRFSGDVCLYFQGTNMLILAVFTLRKDAEISSEPSVSIYQSTRRFLPRMFLSSAVVTWHQYSSKSILITSVYFYFCLAMASLSHDVSWSHTTTRHSPLDSSGTVISSSQRPLPYNAQHAQQTNIHAPCEIRTYDRSRRAAVDLRLTDAATGTGHYKQL